MKTIDIVVAHHKEDLVWIKNFSNFKELHKDYKNYRFFVYSTQAQIIEQLKNLPENKDIKFIHISDEPGFESYALLLHITKHYKDIGDYTFLLQGNPFDQVACNIYSLIMNISDIYFKESNYYPLGKEGCHNPNNILLQDIYRYKAGYVDGIFEPESIKLAIKNISELFKIQEPKGRFLYNISSQMIIKKEGIFKYKRSIYKKALEYAMNKNYVQNWGNGKSNYEAHALERLWQFIFK